MTRASSAPTIKDALVALIAQTTGVTTTYGHPGWGFLPDDVISVGEITATTEVGPIAPTRMRDETTEHTVIISCYRGGADQRRATTAAYALLGAIHTAIQADPRLGGVCRDATITGHTLAESSDPDMMAEGRVAEITLTIRAVARI